MTGYWIAICIFTVCFTIVGVYLGKPDNPNEIEPRTFKEFLQQHNIKL